jgi:hypothetical protein
VAGLSGIKTRSTPMDIALLGRGSGFTPDSDASRVECGEAERLGGRVVGHKDPTHTNGIELLGRGSGFTLDSNTSRVECRRGKGQRRIGEGPQCCAPTHTCVEPS